MIAALAPAFGGAARACAALGVVLPQAVVSALWGVEFQARYAAAMAALPAGADKKAAKDAIIQYLCAPEYVNIISFRRQFGDEAAEVRGANTHQLAHPARIAPHRTYLNPTRSMIDVTQPCPSNTAPPHQSPTRC
jgi:hypothetical protein